MSCPPGPAIELFPYEGPASKETKIPADIGWQHLTIYVYNRDEATRDMKAHDGKRNADSVALSCIEEGDGNDFLYGKPLWGSLLKLISYSTQQT